MMKQFFLLTVLMLSPQLASAFWPFGKTVLTTPLITPVKIEIHGVKNNINAYCFWKYVRNNNKNFNPERLLSWMNSFI